MNLKHAKLCLDCEEIYIDLDSRCPKCAGQYCVFLANWVQPIDVKTVRKILYGKGQKDQGGEK